MDAAMQGLYESRAIKHTGSMVRIPAAALKQQLQQLIHHSLDRREYAQLLGDDHTKLSSV